MTTHWTAEQVLALAPDAGSAKRAQALATASKWPTLGKCDRATWGECQGSGKKPYRTLIDLSEPAFRCSCPSRKFPCKHALGLLLLLAEGETFLEKEIPAWGADWIEKRSQKQTIEHPSKEKKVDEAAQEKRLQKRVEKVEAGLAELEQWMQDIIRQGLVSVSEKPYSFWDSMAARMIDAQAPGLASRVRRLGNICYSGEGWPSRLLQALGDLNLLVQGYKRLEQLPPETKAEVLKQVGFPQKKEDLINRSRQSDPLITRVEDTWLVLGKIVTEEDSLKTQRVWLRGVKSAQSALILSFAHGKRQPLDTSLMSGTSLDASLVFYPGAGQAGKGHRAIVATRTEAAAFEKDKMDWQSVGAKTIEAAMNSYATALSQNPWLSQFLLVLDNILFRYDADAWYVQDTEEKLLPLASHFAQGWELLAMSGGKPLSLAAEWNGRYLLPLSVWSDRSFVVM